MAGEAGIGKTWLLRAFTADRRDRPRAAGKLRSLLAQDLGPFRDMARDAGGRPHLTLAGQDRDAFIDALLDG